MFLERGCRNFLPTLGRIFGFDIQKRLTLNPEHISHIYRPRDGFTKTSNPRKPVPYCCRNSHTKKMPFWCFPDFMNIRLIVHLRENIFSPNLVRKNSATLGQGCCRIFPFSEVNNLTSINSIMNHSFTLLLFIY